MAHDSRRWIRDWRGRLKRSNKATQTDWLNKLGIKRLERRRQRDCPQCKQLNKHAAAQPPIGWRVRVPAPPPLEPPPGLTPAAYLRWHRHVRQQPYRIYKDGRYWVEVAIESDAVHRYPEAQRRPLFGAQHLECAHCRHAERVLWKYWHTGDQAHRWSRSGVPADYRRTYERIRRTEYKQLMRRARQEPELYDDVPMRYRRNIAYHYW